MTRRKISRAPRTAATRFGLLHSFRVHGTLMTCVVLGAALFFLLPDQLSLVARLVISWDAGALLYLIAAISVIARFNLDRAKKRASDQDEGATLILMTTVLAAMVSLGAVIKLVGSAKALPPDMQPLTLSLAVATIFTSWTLIHVMFALHYAHEFFGGTDVGRGGGFRFPDDPQPDYWDFIYFSFVIGMTFQVSDVEVTRKRVRRLVVTHGVISFFFSVTIIALMVNIGASLI